MTGCRAGADSPARYYIFGHNPRMTTRDCGVKKLLKNIPEKVLTGGKAHVIVVKLAAERGALHLVNETMQKPSERTEWARYEEYRKRK